MSEYEDNSGWYFLAQKLADKAFNRGFWLGFFVGGMVSFLGLWFLAWLMGID